MVDDIAAPARIAGKDALSVGMSAEGPDGGEFLSQLDIVINLAVKGDDRAVDPFHRLAGFFAEIDDRPPQLTQARLASPRLPPACPVAPALWHQLDPRPNPQLHPRPTFPLPVQ